MSHLRFRFLSFKYLHEHGASAASYVCRYWLCRYYLTSSSYSVVGCGHTLYTIYGIVCTALVILLRTTKRNQKDSFIQLPTDLSSPCSQLPFRTLKELARYIVKTLLIRNCSSLPSFIRSCRHFWSFDWADRGCVGTLDCYSFSNMSTQPTSQERKVFILQVI